MIQTQFNGQTVFLLDDSWNGNSRFQAEFTQLRDLQASLTSREARRPYSATLRVSSLKFDATVHDAALRQLQGSLRALNTQPIIVPFWPAISDWAGRASAPIKGGLMLVWKEDWSQFDLYTDAEPVWPDADDLVAPAVWGFLTPTEPAMRNPDSAIWSVEFTESSPVNYALVPSNFAFDLGPQPAGYPFAPVLLPCRPDFSRVSEEVLVEVRRDEIGFTRERNQTFYPHAASRSQKASYTLRGDEAGRMLRFFLDVAAPGSLFWAPGWFQVAALTQDVATDEAVLHVEDTAGVNVGDYLALFSIEDFVSRQVIGKTADTITLNAPVGASLMATSSLLVPLCLARMDKPLLSLSWKSPDVATSEVRWTEVPPEYIPAAGETLGVTLGRLLTRVVLFDFSRDLGNGTVIAHRFTNYETDLNWNGNAYTSCSISHGDIRQTINLENSGVEITGFLTEPLVLDVTLKSEAPLWLTIRHADFDGTIVSNVKVVFTGELESVARTGQKLSAKFNFGPASLDDQLPRMIRGQMCNHLTGPNPDGSFLISYGCSLLKADWHFTAKVAAPIIGAYPFTLNLSNLARVAGLEPTCFADWFALGWIEVGSAQAVQRRMILKSDFPVSGSLAITLQRGLEPLPQIGDTVHLYPGCDGMFHTCKAYDAVTNPFGKFGNDPNFGAEPFCPVGNPSLTRLAANPAHGAKK